MSWLFSQALVAEYSAATCSGGEPCALLSVMPTRHPFWRNGKTTDFSGLSRFGLTCAALTADRGEELLTWFLAGFPARTLAQQAAGSALTVNAPACGGKWTESSVRWSRSGSTWRTHRCLLDEDLPSSSVTLPREGLMRAGVVYLPLNSGRRIRGIAPGWSGETLPTPSVAMVKGSSERALTRVDGRSRLRNRLDYWVERDGKAGRLSPPFVEWVMGWPLGWTDAAPLATDKFHEWQRQHSPRSPQTSDLERAA